MDSEFNRLLVEIFHLLQTKDTASSETWGKLARVFGSLTFNNKLFLKFTSDWDKFASTPEKICYFTGTNFKVVFDELNANEQQSIVSNLQKMYNLAQKELLKQYIPPNTDSMFDQLLENQQLKEMLGMSKEKLEKIKQAIKTNPKLAEMLQKSMNNEGTDNESMINLMSNLMKENFGDIGDFLQNSAFQNVLQTLKSSNKTDEIFNAVYNKIHENHPDIVADMEQITKILNTEAVSQALSNIQDKISGIDLTNMNDIFAFSKQYIDENEPIQALLWKLNKSLESGLINLDRMKKNARVVMKLFIDELCVHNLVDSADSSSLLKLFSRRYGKPQVSKKDRQLKRIKNNRRKIRKKLKTEQSK